MEAKSALFLFALISMQCLSNGMSLKNRLTFTVDTDLREMADEVSNQTVLVTEYAASENPNTLTEQGEVANIMGAHVHNFDAEFGKELNDLVTLIEHERQQAGINTPKSLCLKLQETKVDPVKVSANGRAQQVQDKVNTQVNELVETTRQLIHDTVLDLQVKTVVQLCMKIYSGIGQDTQRLTCFDDYGASLTIEQKSTGESLLERVGAIQTQTLRISSKTDSSLRDLYAQDHLDLDVLKQGVAKCDDLPSNPDALFELLKINN